MPRATWIWQFESPPEKVWPALADTARFNEAAALPRYQVETQPQPDGSVVYVGKSKVGPMRLAWRDLPTEWVTNRSFVHARRFQAGPFKTLVATLRLAPAGPGCRAEYTLDVEPANLLGALAIRAGMFRSLGQKFARLAKNAAAFAAEKSPDPFTMAHPRLPEDAAARLQAGAEELARQGVAPDLVRRFAAWIAEGAEVDLARIRPLQLARRWGVADRDAIELCLRAVRAGIVTLRWDILCPNCRGGQVGATALDQLPRGAHCPSCNIDYDRDFSRNVELTFRPAPSIRPLGGGEFCLFGPMTTPHVLVQQTLASGEVRELEAPLPPGDYRVRPLHPGPGVSLTWSGGGFPEITAAADGMHLGAAAPAGRVRLVNRSGREITFVVESRDWVRDALTAHRATSMQIFRDLFSTEVLRPGDEAGIGQVTLMFTDLKGSTAMYGRLGDAGAYRLVREHFAFMAAQIREHDGAIVKTIGDAVMAAFSDPAQALAAALAVQQNVMAFNREHGQGREALIIKLGLHTGPCIAVTLNGRLDYFGSTVNLAARLQAQSRGSDIVLSQALAADPAVAARLAGLPVDAESAQVKGFEAPVAFLRVRPAEAAGAA
ncbi:MAG TPA: adenylate/guanylate cyclase domain-containing protein [Alphaproteobacteria bacterium]|nr:adenylate/guanylate cyclase domain-containing protein [Alphaproteobacteria bacterium]